MCRPRAKSPRQRTNQGRDELGSNQENPEAKENRRESLWGLIVAFAVIGSSQPAGALSKSRTVDQPNLRITLRMYNYAVSRRLLNDAEAEATFILNQTGIEAAWVDCPFRPAEWKNYPDCHNASSTTDFVIRIVATTGQAGRFSKHGEALGEAQECPRDRAGCIANIFYREVPALVRYRDVSQSQVLGHALAHEIGHLLLGPNSHSATGVMRGEWTYRELKTIAQGHLFFTEEQSEQIREEVSARNMIWRDQVARAENR